MSELQKVCESSNYSNIFRNYFALDYGDNVIVYALTPISLICAGLNIYFFCKFPNAREPPFDILLLITILSILNSAVYLSTAIYNQIYPINFSSRSDVSSIPDTFNSFCLVTGTMHFIAEIGVMVYNTVFCLYYTCKIKNPLKSWVRDNKEIHGLCFVLVIIGTVVTYVSNQIGVSVLGICGLKVAKSSVFIQLFIMFIYVAVLITTSVFFLKYLNRIGKFDRKARLFFKYYLLYTLLISVIYLMQCAVMIIMIIDCFTGMSEATYSAFAKTGNILVLITPIISTIVIGFHPEFGQKLIPAICNICASKNHHQRQTFYDSLITTNRRSLDNSFMIELPQMKLENKGYLSSIKQFNRLSLLSTILGCISIFSSRRRDNRVMDNRASMGSNEDDHIFSWNFEDLYEMKVDEDVVHQNGDYFVETIPAVMIKFISHSPSVFQQFMIQDGLEFLEYSTNPNKNLEKIYKNAQADGGSSGQFFFFTHDSRILLKTITTRQLHVLLQRLEAYYIYLKQNPESFIVKIYGVFSAVNPQTGEQIHFMMMGNLCEDINRKYVNRIYDCKGSSHKRQVFKQKKQEQEPEYSKKTMKDIDFDKLEHKIWVENQISHRIKERLKLDSLFFLENGLIDYSLIIIKIDYQAYRQANKGKKITFNRRTMFHNQKQPNMIYVLGIIDYLQTWNVKKKGERWYKSLFNRSETISSQSPTFYSQRFCENLIQKIFM